MHSKRYTITIDKPVAEVFTATLDPKNTPLWLDGITEEQASDSPAKLGTRYKNRGTFGVWSEYTITAFEQNVTFTLSRNDGAYHVKYSFKPINDNQTRFEYFEWEDAGKLENPMPEEAIHKLKQLIERQ
jgi:uncharacterized protein YndB with AHSA1/START domain